MVVRDPRIALVEEDIDVRKRLARCCAAAPSLSLVECDSIRELRDTHRRQPLDIVVMNGLIDGALAYCAEASHEGVRVLLVNVPRDVDWSCDVLLLGARGLVYDGDPPSDVVRALEVVIQDQIWAPRRSVAEALRRQLKAGSDRSSAERALLKRLSSRERQVLQGVAAGLANKELANRLAISEATVKVHVSRIFQKLGVRSRVELTIAYHSVQPTRDSPTSPEVDRRPYDFRLIAGSRTTTG